MTGTDPSSTPAGIQARPLGDLAALARSLGPARAVAIGGSNHYIAEFTALRSRLVRRLVTEFEFEVLAVESGFAEGHLVDQWVRGGPGTVEEVARHGFTFRFGDAPEMHELLQWARAHNAAGGRLRFAGLDVPGSGGSVEPALRRVREYLLAATPESVALVDDAIEACRSYSAANNGLAPARYAVLSSARRDAATAALARVVLQLDALPGSDPKELTIARHHALGALRLDEHLRGIVALAGPNRPASTVSSRDVYQAETVRLLHRLHGPQTADARADEQAPHGIHLSTRPLGPPAADSVERAVADSGMGEEPVVLDLRAGRSGAGPSSIRHVSSHLPVDVTRAFDLLVCLPRMQPSSIAAPEQPPHPSGGEV